MASSLMVRRATKSPQPSNTASQVVKAAPRWRPRKSSSAAAPVGSPQLLLLSGIGPREELAAVGIGCQVDSPHVGKHLKDHLQVSLIFPAPGAGVSMNEFGISFGSARPPRPGGSAPRGSPRRHADAAGASAFEREAERRINEWATTGRGLISSSLYDAACLVFHGPGRPAHP